MAEILPLSSAGARRVQVLLGENLVTVRTYYQELVPVWRMDLFDINSNPLVRGLALVPGVNLLAPHTELTRIYGEFWYITTRGEGNGAEELGDTGNVWWFAPGEAARETADASLDPLSFDADAMFVLA